jgi:hypothetical protein
MNVDITVLRREDAADEKEDNDDRDERDAAAARKRPVAA